MTDELKRFECKQGFERHLEDVINWTVQWKDTPIKELRKGPPGYLERGLRSYGEQYARKNTLITVTITEVPDRIYKPWGTTNPERQKRNDRIVNFRKAGWTFREIGERVKLSPEGAREAYLREMMKGEAK